MTRTYATRRLLEHGPLTMAEFLEITGWTWNAARSVLARLMESGAVQAEKVSAHRCVYRLAA
jgi:predicted ArsR family transcriptional regulator